ncbi:MAG: 2'-5' RNA ligase family protein [Candidatus Kerfeldbacteria bacterium]|nr:2'-5' RNA ligase family protein [Candidatus Kerfeldbacteria bacterium]
MEYILGIHLNVPRSTAKRIVAARNRSNALRRPDQDFEPHVTLYLCRLSRPAFRQLLADIRTRRLPSVVLHLDRVRARTAERDFRFVVLQVRRTKSLVRLHQAVAAAGNRLRAGQLRKKDILRIRIGEYSTFERTTTVRFGYRWAGPGFSPHVTVSRSPVRPSAARHLAQQLRDIVGTSWRAKSLVVGLYRYNNASRRYVGRAVERTVRLR